MTIFIENLTFDAVMGILPYERTVAQKIIVNLELDYEYKKSIFINYETVAILIANSIKQNRFKLIEEALLALHVEIKAKFSQVSSIKLKITKPDIVEDCDVCVALNMNY